MNDLRKPYGTPRKLFDVSMLESTGWKYSTGLRAGIENVYEWYVKNI